MDLINSLPSSFTYFYNFFLDKTLFYGILFIILGIILIFFSRYFKFIFLLFYFLFLLIILSYFFETSLKMLMALFISLLIFMPFLYLALKNGYSMTIINMFMFAYFLLLFPAIKNYLNSYIMISIIIIIIFILAIITFIIFLKLKRRLFLPEGEKI